MTTRTLVIALAAALCGNLGVALAQEAALPAAAAASEVDANQDLVQLRRARDAMLGARDYAGAREPAEAVVTRQVAEHTANYVDDMVALARVHAELGEFDLAEGTYLQAIDVVRREEGEFSIALVEPYHGLGRTYIKNGRFVEAITALEQAQHITQRNLGLFNVEQAELIDDITTAYLGLGDTIEARNLQRERLDNAIRRFGENDPRVIPFHFQLADYYQRSRMTVSAREHYLKALQIQEQHVGANDPALLVSLRQLAKVDLQMTQGASSEHYERLTAILAQNEDIPPVERGLSLAVLGDWATVRGDTVAARDYYKQAWDALSAAPQVDVEAYFSKPTMLDFIAPLSSVDRGTRSKPYAWGSMVFEFDLTAEGRPMNIETVESSPAAGALTSRYTRRLRETHFRPRLVAGEPVATEDVQFTHYFRFYVDEDVARKERG